MTSGIKQATVFSKRRISQDVRDEDQEKVEVEQVKTSKFSKSKDSFIVEPIKKIQRRKNMGLDAIPDAMAEYLNELLERTRVIVAELASEKLDDPIAAMRCWARRRGQARRR